MYTDDLRAEWRRMFELWKKDGVSPWIAGIRKEQPDATTVQRQEPILTIKRDFVAEAQRRHATEAVGPDTRSSYQQKQSQAAKQYVNQQYQKAKDDAKRALGLELMMKTVSPSTYVEAATGLDLGTAGRLATDAAIFGVPGLIKRGISSIAKGVANYRYPLGRPLVPENFLIVKPQIRTKVGDVEIDNPNLLYHLDRGDGVGAFSNRGAYIEDGILFPGIAKESEIPYSWWNLGKPYATSVNRQPMTRLMTTTKDAPGMLHVRSQNYPIGQWDGKRGLVRNTEYVNPDAVNVSSSTYTLDSDYGWRRVFAEESPAAEWPVGRTAPQITAENAASMTSEQWTAAQDAAIARGDMAEAQRLRDLHFKVSAPNTKAVNKLGKPVHNYHGTTNTFNAFDPQKISSTSGDRSGFFFTDSKAVGKFYSHEAGSAWKNLKLMLGLYKGHKPQVYDVYLNTTKPMVTDFHGGVDKVGREILAKEAIKNGNDANILQNIIDGPPALPHNVTIIRNPKHIKSADAVTYDDNGVRIPLGERDNFNINDIRYGLFPFGFGLTGYNYITNTRNEPRNK